MPIYPGYAEENSNNKIPDLTGTPFEGAKIPSGTRLEVSKNGKGETEHILHFPSDVKISATSQGVFGMDNSEHGAILCTREIYFEIKLYFDRCPNLKNKKLTTIIDGFLKKSDVFIVENSIWSVTLNQLAKGRAHKSEQQANEWKKLSSEQKKDICNGDKQDWLKHFSEPEFLKELPAMLEASLAHPRPPVMNPCL